MTKKKVFKPMTPAGYKRIAEEHRELLEDQRPGIVQGIAIAAAEGDRSENAEYIYGKKRLREIDKRLRYLSSLIKDVEIIDPQFIRSDRVEFGATVTIENEEGEQRTWTIVGNGEADVDRGTISWKSPLAKAVLSKKVGDVVELLKPKGEEELEILEIRYEESF